MADADGVSEFVKRSEESIREWTQRRLINANRAAKARLEADPLLHSTPAQLAAERTVREAAARAYTRGEARRVRAERELLAESWWDSWGLGEINYDAKGETVTERTEAAVQRYGLLPSDAGARKSLPMATGVLDYFPDALAAVAEVSRIGNDQHNPGQPLHWDKTKSTDHADSLVRHLVDRGTLDGDGARHSAKVAWRALALLQTEIEEGRPRVGPDRGEQEG